MTHADAPDVLRLFGDDEVTRFMGLATLTDEAGASAFIDDIRGLAEAGSLFQWGVATRSDDRIVGSVTFASIDPRNRRAELGFALSRAHWGRGLAREAVTVALSHAFDELGWHRMEADVDPDNGSSRRLLEKLGFIQEGRMKERWLMGGEWRDTIFYGLLARDWAERG